MATRIRPVPALSLLSLALVVGACRMDSPPERDAARIDTTHQEILSSADLFGASLPNKTLALTFDDGPGDRTSELSSYLAVQGIRATFFVNGARVAPTGLSGGPGLTANAAAHLARLAADGHLVANHTTTHRSLTGANGTQIPVSERVQELAETDADIAPYNATGHWLFRAPFGDWSAAVAGTLNASSMAKYVGPIRWEIGGDQNDYPARAADWACWQGRLNGNQSATTTECGNAYLAEIASVAGQKGIVLMHDPYSWANGSTVDMVKYIVPILKANGYSFVRVDEVPAIAALMPCDAPCATCTLLDAHVCASCYAGSYLAGGACHACSSCGAGQYQVAACSANANVVCGACHASCATCTGGGANQCASCHAGAYRSGGACHPCAACGAGTFESAACTATTNTVCTACDASCAACRGPGPGDCATCSPGHFFAGGSCTACSSCPPGTRRASACTADADAVCVPCAAGTFSSSSNAATCTSCAPGSYSPEGSASCTSCGACDDGDACTADTCDPVAGCVHSTIPACGAPDAEPPRDAGGNDGGATDACATDSGVRPPEVSDGSTDRSDSAGSGGDPTGGGADVSGGGDGASDGGCVVASHGRGSHAAGSIFGVLVAAAAFAARRKRR